MIMKNIQIKGHGVGSLQQFLKENPNEFDALVITNVNYDFPKGVSELCKSHLQLIFDDVIGSKGSYLAPKKEQIEEALNWGKDKENVVVACHAGISRSSACAFLLAHQAWGIDKAFGILNKDVHWPNSLIMKHGSDILNDNQIWIRYTEWNNIKLSLYEDVPLEIIN